LPLPGEWLRNNRTRGISVHRIERCSACQFVILQPKSACSGNSCNTPARRRIRSSSRSVIVAARNALNEFPSTCGRQRIHVQALFGENLRRLASDKSASARFDCSNPRRRACTRYSFSSSARHANLPREAMCGGLRVDFHARHQRRKGESGRPVEHAKRLAQARSCRRKIDHASK